MIKVTNLLNPIPKYDSVRLFYVSKESIEVCNCLSFIWIPIGKKSMDCHEEKEVRFKVEKPP